MADVTDVARISVEVAQQEGYEFLVRFNWGEVPDLLMDEPRPLGGRRGPNASRLLAAAVGNCLCASLMYCVAKEKIPPGSVHSTATCRVVRNDAGRLRIGGIEVTLTVSDAIANSPRLRRCLEVYEDYCTLSTSLRNGIPIDVAVVNAAGERLVPA